MTLQSGEGLLDLASPVTVGVDDPSSIAPASMNGQPWYRVQVGRLAARTEATELQQVLKDEWKI